jgi:hypothetical protein
MPSNQTTLGFYGSQTGGAFYMNNISVIEITDDTDLPRINYTNFDYENGEVVPYSGTGSLKLEPQSTNLIPYSEDFSQWVLDRVTATENQIISPDGTLNATKLSSNSNASNEKTIRLSNDNANRTTSIFAKKGEVTKLISRANVSGWKNVIFDLENGVIEYVGDTTNSFPKIEDYGNGWYRCSVYYTVTQGNANFWLLSDGSHVSNIPIGDGLYIWGGQYEALSYASSYIKSNSGSTTTRLADVCNNAASSDLINSTEGVLYAEISSLADDATNRSISLSDGNVNNRISLLFGTSSNRIRAIVKSNGSTSFDEEYEVTSTLNYHKCAIKFKENDFALWIDSVERFTDTSGSTPIGLDRITFDVGSGILNFYGNVKTVAVFKEALDNDQLERLTGEGYETFKLLAQANNYTII